MCHLKYRVLLNFCIFSFVIYVCKSDALNITEVKLNEALCYSVCQQQVSCDFFNCSCQNTAVQKDFKKFQLTYMKEPKLRCKSESLANFFWKNEDYVYFLEVANEENRFYSDVISCDSYTLEGLTENTSYEMRFWGVSYNKSLIGKSNFFNVKTNQKNIDPLPVVEISLVKLILKDFKYDALIKWIPAEDLSCFYDFVWFGGDSMGDYKQLEINNPATLYEAYIKDLEFDSNYSISIMAKSSRSDRESEKTWLYVVTPSCLETYSNLNKCPPAIPENLLVNEYVVDVNAEENPLYNIKVTWSAPDFLPDYYVAYFMNLIPTSLNNTAKYLNISGDSTEAMFVKVELGIYYQIGLTAWSVAGSSDLAVQNRHVLGSRAAIISTSQIWSIPELILTIVGPLSVIFVIIVLVVLFNYYRAKHKRFEQRRKYFIELEQKSPERIETIVVDSKNDNYVDEWEIEPEMLLLQTVLGEGAFGIVRRAWLEDKSGKKSQVAIKMLKDFPSNDEVRQFHQEIDIMKSVGAHPHLVSIIGCITQNRPEGPLLVVEYCSRGDLQTYLRQTWEKLTNQTLFGIHYVNTTNFDLGKNFSNKLYDMESILQEQIIEPKDLISFARQITIGMEYLSNVRVVHRDLAARNVLVCENKTVKVSDFGLSRDIYRDNVYCKSGGGKLPIRWMALESLTHQRYTTQSDVWSFGILLWEIVTLGGSPYPGVASQNILYLLKNGYRMEKPINCTNDLYSVMMNCWRASAKERPTFTELRKVFDNLLENEIEYLHLDFSDTLSNNSSYNSTSNKILPKKTVSYERYVKPIKLV